MGKEELNAVWCVEYHRGRFKRFLPCPDATPDVEMQGILYKRAQRALPAHRGLLQLFANFLLPPAKVKK